MLPRKCMAPVAETRRDETRERSALGRPDISDPDFTQTSEHRTSPREKAHHLMPYGNYLLTSLHHCRTAHWHRHWRAPSTTLHHREPSRLLCYLLWSEPNAGTVPAGRWWRRPPTHSTVRLGDGDSDSDSDDRPDDDDSGVCAIRGPGPARFVTGAKRAESWKDALYLIPYVNY